MSEPKNPSPADEIAQRLGFLRITDADTKALRKAAPKLVSDLPEVIEGLYEHLRRYDEPRELLGSNATVERLKGVQKRYFERLLDGHFDADYFEHRINVGGVHERIGVTPIFYLGAFAFALREWLPTIIDAFDGDPAGLEATLGAIIKAVLLDVSLTIDTYVERREATARAIVRQFTETVSDYVHRLDTATTEITDTTQTQAEATERQASAVAEIATAMAELTQTAKQALGQAEGVMQITEHTIEVARDGKEAVTQVSSGMDEIRQQMETLSERILLLNEQTEQIGDIISSVSEISEQSKLLALNAAIEAARAGEHGRGFAVVATEIRNLADQSKQSTLQVRNILGDIKKATNAAVLATEQGTMSVERGATLAQTAGERFHELADAVEESGESARLIATISRQQGEGVQQISVAMDDINSNTVQTTHGMSAISESTVGLSSIAENMRELIRSFVEQGAPVASDNVPDPDDTAVDV